MASGIRVLVASPLHEIAVRLIEADPALDDPSCTAAGTKKAVRAAIKGRFRHDVALVDLLWGDDVRESKFDGLDVLEMLESEDRHAPVILAVQGQPFEHAHLAEAMSHSLVKGVIRKSDGPMDLPRSIRQVAAGKTLQYRAADLLPTRDRKHPIHEYFKTRRGRTTGKIAAAIAAGEVHDNATLAAATQFGTGTVSRWSDYFGDLILSRREAPSDGTVNAAVVYRWCGENSQYLLSWGRRNGPDH